MITMTIAEFQAALKAQGVKRHEHLAFRCPMCDTLQSAQDLIEAGAGADFDAVEKYLGFSCVGRWTNAGPPPEKKGTQKGCNWTLGGFLTITDLVVIAEDGTKHPRFMPASRWMPKCTQRGGLEYEHT